LSAQRRSPGRDVVTIGDIGEDAVVGAVALGDGLDNERA
jgi:hypothetical protein